MTDYSELIHVLRCCALPDPCSMTDCPRKGTDEDCACHVLQDAAAAIEDLQALYKQMDKRNTDLHNEGFDVGYWAGKRDAHPHWVSVKERLPEIGQLILLYYGGCFSIAARTEDEMFEGKRYWKLEDGYWERIEDDYYWMPIEPPQEVQE